MSIDAAARVVEVLIRLRPIMRLYELGRHLREETRRSRRELNARIQAETDERERQRRMREHRRKLREIDRELELTPEMDPRRGPLVAEKLELEQRLLGLQKWKPL